MTGRVLLGIAEATLAGDVRAVLAEGTDLEVVGTAASGPAVMAACEHQDVDVALLHEGLGPLPLLHLARDLGSRFPTVGVVLLVADPTPELLRGALQSGARGVASLPLSLDALEADLSAAAAWGRSMRTRLEAARGDPAGGEPSARMVAVAGAKGGVGTTTIALHLAFEAARARSACLVDFDLQAGDVLHYLDVENRRSVADLLEVAEDLTARHLDETLYRHPSGLQILLAPPHGEQAEDINGAHVRHILGAIRNRFDVVVVDVGSVMTEGSAAATELADVVLLVTTPDVPAMRAANRLLLLWERLDIRKDGISVLVNRASKASDVQPDLVESVVPVPRVPVTVPADYKSLQPAMNFGSPERAAESSVRQAVGAVGGHLGLWDAGQRTTSGGRGFLRRGERGQSAVEVAGVAPFVLLILALALQIGLVGLTFVFAGHAATEGARQLAVGASMTEAQSHAAGRMPATWSDTLDLRAAGSAGDGRRRVEASVRVPLIVPGIDPDVRVRSASGYVLESEVGGQSP